jgi:hypothetical protein
LDVYKSFWSDHRLYRARFPHVGRQVSRRPDGQSGLAGLLDGFEIFIPEPATAQNALLNHV